MPLFEFNSEISIPVLKDLLVCMCTCVCVCVCVIVVAVYVCRCLCVLLYGMARSQHRIFPSFTLHFI